MSALFYIIKAACWVLIGVVVDLALDIFAIFDRLPTLAWVVLAIFAFEMLMDKTGGNKKLSVFVQDR